VTPVCQAISCRHYNRSKDLRSGDDFSTLFFFGSQALLPVKKEGVERQSPESRSSRIFLDRVLGEPS
jgi:hypothetical protein